MPGDEDEYELLSHDEVEQLRREAHQGAGDITEAIHEIKRTKESIDDLRRLLSSVKDHILEDYAKSPNPEATLQDIKQENKQIAESLVDVIEHIQNIESQQDQLRQRIDQVNTKIQSQQPRQQPSQQRPQQSQPRNQQSQSYDESLDDLDTMKEPGDPALKDLDESDIQSPSEKDDGFFSNMLGS